MEGQLQTVQLRNETASAPRQAQAAATRLGWSCSAGAWPGAAGTRVSVSLNTSAAGPQRSFLLTLPASSAPAALVFALHGGTDSPSAFLDFASPPVDATLTARGFVVLTPAALVNPACPLDTGGCTYWGGLLTPSDPIYVADATSPADEVRFLWEAVACVRSTLGVPLSGDVFAMGVSQGGKLSTLLACSTAPEGMWVRGVVASEGVRSSLADSPACFGPSAPAKPPALLVFQAESDSVMPFCRAGAFAAGALYWNTWADSFNDCTPWLLPLGTDGDITTHESNGVVHTPPVLRSLCPSANSAVTSSSTTSLLRVYTLGAGCTSPMALFWLREAANGGHLWPSRLDALGGADGAEVSASFFEALVAGGTSDEQVFLPMLTGFAACSKGGALLGRTPGPCSDGTAAAAPPPGLQSWA